MTTAIPTSDDAENTGRILGTGLPDEATLANLANAFFRLLPGAQLPPTPGTAQPSSTVPAVEAPTPDAVPPLSGPQLGVPEAYAASLPSVESEPRPSTAAPFYFLAEANLYTSKVTTARPSEDHVTAQPSSMPGASDLYNVLAGISLGYGHGESPSVPASPRDADRPFYFVDPVGAETGALPVAPQSGHAPFDVHTVRKDFPALHQKVHGKPLIWLDSAATSQKPQQVIDVEAAFYEHDNSNIHRAAHALAARATDAYEGARAKIQRFIGAASPNEIIFVRGTTEGVNLLAQTCGRQRIQPGDEIVLTTIEHHANIVPWQFLAKEKGAILKVVPINNRGEILLHEYEKLLGPRTRIVALTHVSNTLGTVVPVELMTAMAHHYGAAVVVDGAQSIPHFRVDVQAIDCDFFVFSGHKLFAPTGIGVLYGKKALLDEMPPWQGGGNMIEHVTFEHTTFNKVPYKFEAGTGHIAGAVGLGAAIDYLNRIGFEAAASYEDGLLAYASQRLATIPGLRLMGTAPHKVGVVSFVLDGIKPEAVGKFLDQDGIAVRAGHHCAQPTMQRFNVTGMVRPSLAFYNTYDEVDALYTSVLKAKKALS